MNRSVAWALALSLLSIAARAEAQHALPVAALAGDGLEVLSITAPDEAALPVRIVLASNGARRFALDVWVTASPAAASAVFDARRETLSTTAVSERRDLAPGGRALASAPSGVASLVMVVVSNVVLVVRAIEPGDASALAERLAAAVMASEPGPAALVHAPDALGQATTIQTPTRSVAFLVTCENGCRARRVAAGFLVERETGEASLSLHAVDGQLRATHVHAAYP